MMVLVPTAKMTPMENSTLVKGTAYDGIQAENHEGCHRSGCEMQELR